jgi:hypothetical protein
MYWNRHIWKDSLMECNIVDKINNYNVIFWIKSSDGV